MSSPTVSRMVSVLILVFICGAAYSDEGARRIAWLEGEYESGYEPNRELAEKKLKSWEGKVPALEDTDEYLDYLSILDATSKSGESGQKIREYLSKYPNEKRAVFLFAVHSLRKNKKELARHLFQQLEKDSAFKWKSHVYNNLALMALSENKQGVALSLLEKAVKAEPASAAPHVNLGAIYLGSRSFGEAEKLFQKALDLDGDFEDAALGLGCALEGLGKFDEAHEVYTQFIEAHPDAMSPLFNDSILLGNRLKQRDAAAQQMLRYIQRGGKETAKAHEIIRGWR